MMRTTPRHLMVLGLALASALSLVGGEAEAQRQFSTTMRVQTQVSLGCTFTATNFTFTGYLIGQTTPQNGSTSWNVNCPGIGGGRQLPVRFTMSTTAGSFRMRAGGAPTNLNYVLCNDPACTEVYANATQGPSVGVNSSPFAYTLHGQILANQPVPRGTYNQSVRVFLSY